jgi:hypothetical protein
VFFSGSRVLGCRIRPNIGGKRRDTENGASGNLIPRLKGRNHDFESCQLSDVCLSSKVAVNCAAAPMIARYLPIVDDLLLVALRESASNSSKEFASRAAAAYSAGWISIAEVRRKVRGGLLYYGGFAVPDAGSAHPDALPGNGVCDHPCPDFVAARSHLFTTTILGMRPSPLSIGEIAAKMSA